MNILEKVNEALAGLGTPMGAGTLIADPLPETFIVYRDSSAPEQHADDRETLRSYFVQVSIFTKLGLSDLPDVDESMLAAGFMKGSERLETYSMADGYFHLSKDFSYYSPA